MTTLTLLLIALTGGVSAVLGTFVWLTTLLLRRARNLPVRFSLRELRWVWAISGAIGIPLILPSTPSIVVQEANALMPWLYVACVLLLAANVSMAAGTALCFAFIGVPRLGRLLANRRIDPTSIGWQRAVVWAVSAVVGVRLLAGSMDAVIQAVARW